MMHSFVFDNGSAFVINEGTNLKEISLHDFTECDNSTEENIGNECAINVLAYMTKDTDIKPIPSCNRFGMSNCIFLMDSIPEVTPSGLHAATHKKYIVEEDVELDFWNDISGFFHSNDNAGISIYDYRSTNWEIPSDITIRGVGSIDSKYIPISVGDRIVDSNYKVYKVVGFFNSNGSIDRYFNIR